MLASSFIDWSPPMYLPTDLVLAGGCSGVGVKGLSESFTHEATEASSYVWLFCLEASALIRACAPPWPWLAKWMG